MEPHWLYRLSIQSLCIKLNVDEDLIEVQHQQMERREGKNAQLPYTCTRDY